MASSKKELCPQCKTNMKGVSAKTCKSCQIAAMGVARKAKAKKGKATTPKIEPKSTNVEVDTSMPVPTQTTELPKVGQLTADGKYYL